jgi:tetratricopeptide (TPR) repeat protein
MTVSPTRLIVIGWCVSVAGAAGVRVWNAVFGPLFYGYDAWGHISYVFFLDMYRSIPYADQGWSYFHPPLHYLFGWALMQAGNPKVLVVGLSLLGGAASLGVAALAIGPIRRALPERPALALLGFTAVAYLPVHVYVSPMPGNEMTAAFFAAAAFAAHLRNESRSQPTLAGDAFTGALAGLAMLAKFTDVIACLAIAALTGLRWLRCGDLRARLPRLGVRALAVGIPLLLIAAPNYARNLAEFGTPFMTSAAVHDVARIQSEQPPGERGALDFLRLPLEVFDDSRPTAPHMLHAVWPTAYLNIWFDTFRESQLPFPRNLSPQPFIHQLTILFGLLGLLPTLVALHGAGLSLRRALRERDNCLELGMLLLTLGTLSVFVLFANRVPTWAALKASYLLNLSLPFAFFMARGAQAWASRDAWLGALPGLAIGLLAIAVLGVFSSGLSLRRDFDSEQMASVMAQFGNFGPTRNIYRIDAFQRSDVEARAAVELFDGQPAAASRFYTRAAELPLRDPTQRVYFQNRRGVAAALEGATRRARRYFERALETKPDLKEALLNRGALAAQAGDFAAAAIDLRATLQIDPQLAPAWTNLAVVLAFQGRHEEASRARERAAEARAAAARGFPYGVGNGYLYDNGAGQRFMLILAEEGDALTLYRPPRSHPAQR